MRLFHSLVVAGLALAVFSLAAADAVAAPPFGDWKFRYMKLRGKKIRVIPGSRITWSLKRDNRCHGSAGVNTYFGECVINENRERIRFPSGFGLTRKGGPPNLMRQESRYLEYLQRSKRFQLRGERLKLISGNKRIELVFRRQDAP